MKVQAGDIIARRFVVVRAEEVDLPGIDRFLAKDTRLDIDVTVDIVTALAPSSVIRAAQRARVVRDKRLVRVLAAGIDRHNDSRLSYIVTERPLGVRLDALLGKVAFAPASAAAVVGEAAAALAAVLSGANHHGMVRPEAITITETGRVMLSGLGIDGELASQAGMAKGRTQRADAIALAGVYVTAVTAKAPEDATKADIPDDVPAAAKKLCERFISGAGPATLAEVVGALGTGDSRILRAVVAEAPTLWWPRAIGGLAPDLADSEAPASEAPSVDVVAGAGTAPVDTALVGTAPVDTAQVTDEESADIAVDATADTFDADDTTITEDDTDSEDHTEAGTELVLLGATDVAPPAARPLTRFGRAVDDLDEFHDIVADQNVTAPPSVAEAILERLHQRFPRSTPLANAATAAHRRAQASAPLNVAPLLVSILVVAVFVAAIVATALLTKPFAPDYDGYNNPPQTYPEFTPGQTPTPTP